jgi:exportin-1
MHERHPGVQDMSVDTFLKIARKCRKKFIVTQQHEPRPFIHDILENLAFTVKDMEHGQIHTFYQAVGVIIGAEEKPDARQALILRLMELPNSSVTYLLTHNTLFC